MTVFRWLNNNIGCIEIGHNRRDPKIVDKLNNNIGCIEILEMLLLFFG